MPAETGTPALLEPTPVISECWIKNDGAFTCVAEALQGNRITLGANLKVAFDRPARTCYVNGFTAGLELRCFPYRPVPKIRSGRAAFLNYPQATLAGGVISNFKKTEHIYGAYSSDR